MAYIAYTGHQPWDVMQRMPVHDLYDLAADLAELVERANTPPEPTT
jgi:uncharacterized protein (DUF169 family)